MSSSRLVTREPSFKPPTPTPHPHPTKTRKRTVECGVRACNLFPLPYLATSRLCLPTCAREATTSINHITNRRAPKSSPHPRPHHTAARARAKLRRQARSPERSSRPTRVSRLAREVCECLWLSPGHSSRRGWPEPGTEGGLLLWA